MDCYGDGTMARNPNALSRMEVLILASLARKPMHAYEVKIELRYKHVRWWAKCEHGHLYATFARLEKRKDIARTKQKGRIKLDDDGRGARVYAITPRGRQRLDEALAALADAADETYFDVDLFVSSSFAVSQSEAVELLQRRVERLRQQQQQAIALRSAMGGNVPLAGKLIMDHRIEHLAREIAFAERVAALFAVEKKWGPFLGDKSVLDFIKQTGVPIESSA